MLKLDYLVSGGIITNYNCSSKCRHCVYASSPSWPKDYMTSDTSDEIFSILKKFGCHSVHIGGGEPLLQPDRIFPVLRSAKRNRMDIEYVETNASWFKDAASAETILTRLMKDGVYTLLISIDPFHNEYIPFWKVKGLIEVCTKVNMGVFPWLMEFWPDLDAMDDQKPHSLEEYAKIFGEDYLSKLPKRYGLNFNGRALQTYKTMMKTETLDNILNNAEPCRLLSGIHHFHVDLYGNFIPQSCPGLSVKLNELFPSADPDKYMLFHTLNSVGISGLFELGVKKYGYRPKAQYAGKCDLCFELRKFLVIDKELDFPDLQPTGYYRFV